MKKYLVLAWIAFAIGLACVIAEEVLFYGQRIHMLVAAGAILLLYYFLTAALKLFRENKRQDPEELRFHDRAYIGTLSYYFCLILFVEPPKNGWIFTICMVTTFFCCILLIFLFANYHFRLYREEMMKKLYAPDSSEDE